jgi:phosphatidylserine/phosphatidylglycerophosphate/cardiolipin synthase-like enzyme
MSSPKAIKLAIKLENARQELKRMVDGESAFRRRVAGLSAEQQAKALEWFYRGCDKQRARIQQLEFELEKGLLI